MAAGSRAHGRAIRQAGVAPSAPRWAVLAAYGAVLSVVPSGVWRTAVGLGVPLGWSDEHLRLERIPGEGTRYVISLTALTLGAALLTLGLVQRWGEVVPGWVPVVGGRRVPTLLAVVPATAGALTVTTVAAVSAVHWDDVSGFADDPDSGWARLMALCYAPALLWGPLLAAVTMAYWRRRRSAGARS